MRAAPRRTLAWTLLWALLVAACGTRVSREEVVAAAGGAAGGPAAESTVPARSAPADQQRVGTSDPETAGPATSEQPAVPGDATGPAPPPEDREGGSVATTAPDGTDGSTASSGGAEAPARQDSPRTAAQAPDQQAASGPPIRLGSVGNYSGSTGATMGQGAEAMRVWARWVNDRGGIDGRPVELIIRDDGQDPARHQALVKELVEDHGVVAFVGQLAPFTLPAAKDYLESVRVPVVGGECSHEAWDTSPMFFPQCATYLHGIFGNVHVGGSFADGTRFGALTCVEADTCTRIAQLWFDEGQAEEAGLEPVYQSDISIAQPDFTAECLEARNQGVELLSVVADVNTVARVARSCARQDYHPQFLQGGGTTNARIAELPEFDNTLVKVNVFPHLDTDTPATREFAEAFATYAPDVDLAASHALGWSAAKLFERAAELAGAAPSTSEDVLEGLWQMRDDTLGGLVTPLTFVRDEVPPERRCYFYMKIVGGEFTAPQGVEPLCRP